MDRYYMDRFLILLNSKVKKYMSQCGCLCT